jgi:hypothetical protein
MHGTCVPSLRQRVLGCQLFRTPLARYVATIASWGSHSCVEVLFAIAIKRPKATCFGNGRPTRSSTTRALASFVGRQNPMSKLRNFGCYVT